MNKSQENRLNNQFLYTTPFSNDLTEAITRLYGEMVTQELYVDKESGKALLSELSLIIDQKSEIPVYGSDYTNKIIDGKYLKNLFTRVQQIELFNELLNKSKYNTFKKDRIRHERTKIMVAYQNTKKKAKEICIYKNLDFETLSEDELIDELIIIVKDIDNTIDNENLVIAIAIECLCELWGGET